MTKKLTIIGIGKLGLCNALSLERVGYHVLGVDIFQGYVDQLNNKIYHSFEPIVNEYLQASQNFRATTDLKEGLEFSDLIWIVVDTPNGGGENFYDHSKLSRLLMKINDYKIKNKHLVVCCTTMPGYISRIGKNLLDKCENVTLNYNPEFIAQGAIIKGFENPDMVLIGEETEEAGKLIEEVHHNVTKNDPKICRMPTLEAEITKITVNGFITMKISYANMIGDACDSCGADKFKIMEAVGQDQRIGVKCLKPGYSFGGPCFPRDTQCLGQFIDKVGGYPILSEASRKYNDYHTEFQTRQILNELHEKRQDRYTISDICYKEESKVPIIEESAKIKIARNLAKNGINVTIRDQKHLIDLARMEYGDLFGYEVIE